MPPYLRYKNRSLHGGVNQRAFEQDISDVEAADMLNMDVTVPGLRVKRKGPSTLFDLEESMEGRTVIRALDTPVRMCPDGAANGGNFVSGTLRSDVGGTLQWILNDNDTTGNQFVFFFVIESVEYSYTGSTNTYQNIITILPDVVYPFTAYGVVNINPGGLQCLFNVCGDLDTMQGANDPGCPLSGADPAGAASPVYPEPNFKAWSMLLKVI